MISTNEMREVIDICREAAGKLDRIDQPTISSTPRDFLLGYADKLSRAIRHLEETSTDSNSFRQR